MKHNAAIFTLLLILGISLKSHGQGSSSDSLAQGKGYVVEQPGTITFSRGVKIVGKVEKPQVMIFLPKERSNYREITFDHSFKNDISEPLPFDPIVH